MTNYFIDPIVIEIGAEHSSDLTGCLGNPYLGCNVELKTKDGAPAMLKGKTFTSSMEVLHLAAKAKNIPKTVEAYFIFDNLEPVMPEEYQQYYLLFTVYDLSMHGNDSYLTQICALSTLPFEIQFVDKWVNNPKEFGGSTPFTRKLGDKNKIGLKLRVYNVAKSRVRVNQWEEYALQTANAAGTRSTQGDASPPNAYHGNFGPRPAVPNDVLRRGSEDSANSNHNKKVPSKKARYTDISGDVLDEKCAQPKATVPGASTMEPFQSTNDMSCPLTRGITQTMDNMALEPSMLPPMLVQPDYAHQSVMPSPLPKPGELSQEMYNNFGESHMFNGQDGNFGIHNAMAQGGLMNQRHQTTQAYAATCCATTPDQMGNQQWPQPLSGQLEQQQQAQGVAVEMNSYQWDNEQFVSQHWQ
jgi:hypothetical protein